MPCQCAPPPPPIFDLPPPPDPSLILHLLFDEPTTSSSSSSSLDGVEKFQQFSPVQSCPAASSSTTSVVGIFAGWWAQFQGAGADFFLPWLALSLFCLCLISSGAALALRWRRRRSRKMLRSNETILDGKSSRKRATSTKSANTSMTSPTTLPLGGGYSSSGTTSATDSPEHYCEDVNAGHFSPRSSIETMASATSPIDKKQKAKGGGEGGWHFQPNFFAFATNITAGQFRPNTVGASRRKMPSSIGHHHHHPHHGHFHPHSQCCSPPTSCHGIGVPFPTTTISPPRTVALRMPRHFSSHEGQFVAWRTATAENGIPPTPCSFYGFGGNGSELYEELGETAEDVAEAPYKWRQQQQQRMPPPSTRPPPPPPVEHLPTLANANRSPESSLSGANSTGSDEDAEMGGSGGSRRRQNEVKVHDAGATNYYSIAANGMIGQCQQSSNNSRTESGYGTAGRNVARGKGCQRQNEGGGNGGGGSSGGLWRNNPQQIGGIKQQQQQQSPPLNHQVEEEGEYIERRRQKVAAMTYV